MNFHVQDGFAQPDDAVVQREGRRLLRRLAEQGSCLALARDMEKAVIVREDEFGQTVRVGVVDRAVAQAFAARDWITCRKPARVSRFHITAAGRSALRRMQGKGDDDTAFADQHRDFDQVGTKPRINLAESPVAAIARRRGKDGKPFLCASLVAAADRLREDFELSQMGPRVTQDWDRFLAKCDHSYSPDKGKLVGADGARHRVINALQDLGPGLGDIALRVCCFLEGVESAEQRMGWSARSGKVVLRIALHRLRRHYEENGRSVMIG
ncbi:MAG: DUF6456 domain-containing protein [Paracoccaceae bacterium]|nr:DUF6456 domain-containing protein [Paracoccaceae bacterium]